ncbi:MAG TPA: long-chain fatty acid--CoA ligase, partial [Polyangiaceae bacterium]|nr:long-chain fatty acid--CoA ligase [Polyangiaceae bacterium]
YTYADAELRARKLAQALARLGMQSGDRVGSLAWNGYRHLELYYAVSGSGAVLHTLNPRLPPEQLGWIANDAEDRFLIVDETLLPVLDKWRARARLERVFVARDEAGSPQPLPPGCESYERFIAEPPGAFAPPPLGENDPAGLCYTSGTVGDPKGVLYTHRSTVLHSLVASLPDCLAISRRDSVLPVVPMFHVNAWGMPYAAIMNGAKLVLPGRHLDPISLLDLFQSEQVTITGGVPSIWIGILQALDREPGRWKLRRMLMAVGGAAAPEALIRGFDRHGQDVVHAWGMTETSPMGTVSRLKPHLEALSESDRYRYRCTQGLPPPLMDVRIVSDAGVAAHDGESMGELQVRSPWVAAAYFGASQDPSKFTADGWFCTGDIATIDPEGYVTIVDRSKDLVKSGGEWISSVALENALMSHPAVLEACVIAVPNTQWGERPLALVTFRDAASAAPDELRAHLAQRVPKWWLPEGYVVLGEIPKNATGKFAKRALRARFAEWRPEP